MEPPNIDRVRATRGDRPTLWTPPSDKGSHGLVYDPFHQMTVLLHFAPNSPHAGCSRCAQSVERADDARRIVSRRKRTRECRLRTPAGTVPRRDDPRPDTIGEVVDGRLDPRLHALACQMIAAEDDVDRLAPERAQRAERCVHDACVRARREHTDAAAAHARREE